MEHMPRKPPTPGVRKLGCTYTDPSEHSSRVVSAFQLSLPPTCIQIWSSVQLPFKPIRMAKGGRTGLGVGSNSFSLHRHATMMEGYDRWGGGNLNVLHAHPVTGIQPSTSSPGSGRSEEPWHIFIVSPGCPCKPHWRRGGGSWFIQSAHSTLPHFTSPAQIAGGCLPPTDFSSLVLSFNICLNPF